MMEDLPLFPLHTVLFPGMPLGLHIFEERYKRLVGDCIQAEGPFGVVLIRKGDEIGEGAEPHNVGCTARISRVQRLEDGRMNIVAVGEERFRIVSLSGDRPYLVGHVEPYPLDAGNQSALAAAGQRLMPFVERYLEILATVSEEETEVGPLPDDPLALGYLAATLLQVPAPRKQALLAADEAPALLNDVRQLYRRELPLLQLMLQQNRAGPADDELPFSLN